MARRCPDPPVCCEPNDTDLIPMVSNHHGELFHVIPMRFCDTGPDVPDELIRAQLAGNVVFVIGAGVSQRVGLPSFAQLAARVYERVGQACPGTADSLADIAEVDAWSRKEWDRTLGL